METEISKRRTDRTANRFLPIVLAALAAAPGAARAQAFDPGPMGIVPGSSVAGARIDGAPRAQGAPGIPNVDIFGDTAAERYYGREFDDSYLRPKVPSGRAHRSNEATATEGRPDLNAINAGEFAREGPNAIGRSSVTRGSSLGRGGRARIVPSR